MFLCNETIKQPGLPYKDLQRIREFVQEFLEVPERLGLSSSSSNSNNVSLPNNQPIYAQAEVLETNLTQIVVPIIEISTEEDGKDAFKS